MSLTLAYVAENPQQFTTTIERNSESFVIRPLHGDDVFAAAQFLAGLSEQTRYFSTFSGYDIQAAQELCDAIARYDKLRFVIEKSTDRTIIGLIEFSFAITENDSSRYSAHNIILDPQFDCRFGPTLADAYQNKGLGTLMIPFVVETARRFGKKRIILWGGVLSDNTRAVRFYRKNGFVLLGPFTNQDGIECLDMYLDLPAV